MLEYPESLDVAGTGQEKSTINNGALFVNGRKGLRTHPLGDIIEDDDHREDQ